MSSLHLIQNFFCNYLGYFCPTNPRISADGKQIHTGDKVLVFGKSLMPGAMAAADILTATGKACPDRSQINFTNSLGEVCLDPADVYVDISKSLRAVAEGKAHILPYPLSIHESD